MNKITKVSTLKNPKFVKAIALEYSQNSEIKEWEAVITHDSVSILLWHKDKNSFVLVKQLRPAVLNTNPNNGYMYELCAGIVDKQCSLKQIAKEEVLEECGYDIPLEALQEMSSFYTSVGISGSKQTLYYAQIDNSMKISDGGGLEEEEIEVIYLEVDKAKEFMFDDAYQKTPGMMMAFYWWFDQVKI